MSKHYRVKFSSSKDTFPTVDENGKQGTVQIRLIEKTMLESLFNATGGAAKTFFEQRIAADNFANVNAISLETPEASILFTEEDYKQLQKGMELTAGQRPPVWNRLLKLIIQLEKPTEEKVE